MPHFNKIVTANVFIIILGSLISCAKPDVTPALASDLNGVWTIESIASDPATQQFSKTYYNVQIEDDGENINIIHCNADNNMLFTRDEHNLNDVNGTTKLHIVSGTIIESVDIAQIVQLTKTDKSSYFNAGSIRLESDVLGVIDSNNDICAQNFVNPDAPEGARNLVFSVPFNNDRIKIALEYTEKDNGSIDTIGNFTLSAKSFTLDDLYNEYSITPYRTYTIAASTTNSTATIEFDFNTRSYSTPTYLNIGGDNIIGQIQVRF